MNFIVPLLKNVVLIRRRRHVLDHAVNSFNAAALISKVGVILGSDAHEVACHAITLWLKKVSDKYL